MLWTDDRNAAEFNPEADFDRNPYTFQIRD